MFQRRLPDSAEDYDWLSGQQGPEEEAQAVVVSVFLSFVPFQIPKRTRQHSREIISIALKRQSSDERKHPRVFLERPERSTVVCSNHSGDCLADGNCMSSQAAQTARNLTIEVYNPTN